MGYKIILPVIVFDLRHTNRTIYWRNIVFQDDDDDGDDDDDAISLIGPSR